MSYQNDSVSYHVKDNFILKIGREERMIEVPRLLFKNADKVLGILSDILAKDAAAALEIAMQGLKIDVSTDNNIAMDYAKYLTEILPRLLRHKGYDIIKEILLIISEGAVTDEVIETMQYGEAVNTLCYLIDQNFESLKNLSASLQTITIQSKSSRD